MKLSARVISSALGIFCAGLYDAHACSLLGGEGIDAAINAEAADYAAMAAIVVAGLLVIDLFARRVSLSLVVAVIVMLAHPAWTFPAHEMDCSSIKIEASIAALLLVVILFSVRCLLAFRALR